MTVEPWATMPRPNGTLALIGGRIDIPPSVFLACPKCRVDVQAAAGWCWHADTCQTCCNEHRSRWAPA